MEKKQKKVKLLRDIRNRFVTFKKDSVGVVEEKDGIFEFSSIPETAFWVVCNKKDFIEISK